MSYRNDTLELLTGAIEVYGHVTKEYEIYLTFHNKLVDQGGKYVGSTQINFPIMDVGDALRLASYIVQRCEIAQDKRSQNIKDHAKLASAKAIQDFVKEEVEANG